MRKIGMLVAVEIDAVLKKYGAPGRIDNHGDYQVRVYENPGYSLYVIHSGIGEINAAAGTQILISAYGVEMIVNFGVVGGLTADMKVTGTCIVSKAVHYDMDLSAMDGSAPAKYPELPDIFIPTDEKLLEMAVEYAPELKPVICASADKFVGDPEAKRALNTCFGAEICDMESAAIALVCHKNHIPCMQIKSVSDSIEGGAEEFASEINRASDVCLGVVSKIITNI